MHIQVLAVSVPDSPTITEPPVFHPTACLSACIIGVSSPSWCCRYESLGSEGYHSLYRWYQAFEATHFPDPMGLRETVATWTLGVYPNCLKYAMAIFDVPETIAVTRKMLCQSGVASLTRIQVQVTLWDFEAMLSLPDNISM